MKGSRTYRGAVVAAFAVLAVGVAACSSGSSTAMGTAPTSNAGGATGAPELSTISIGLLPSADAVTIQIAQDKGFFKQQGLNVKVTDMTTTNQATTGLLSDTMDFATENYVGMYEQELAVPNLHLKIVADNTQATPDDYVLMVAKNSNITSISQLKGKKIGFPALGYNFGAMALDVLLAPYHESSASFTTVAVPFSNAEQALATGEVDAIFTTEPFETTAEAGAGDRVLIDMMSGPLANMPEGCWGTTASFAQKYPKTVAAFQRAMQEAAQVAATSPSYVRSELPRLIPTMKPALANVIVLPSWNTTLSLTRMQRVADLMQQTGGFKPGVNVNTLVSSMYDPLASSAS
jgi:NitT/TauT family transport system substrate-binding protein